MTAMAGAGGARAWIQAHGGAWVTPKRMKAATVSLFIAATLLSSVGLSSSTKTSPQSRPAPVAAHDTAAR